MMQSKKYQSDNKNYYFLRFKKRWKERKTGLN